VVCGCGSSETGQYAGLDEYEARTEIVRAMGDQVADRTSPVYRHRVTLQSVRMSHDPQGLKAWVGTYDDRTSARKVCVWVIGEQHAFGANVRIELGDCGAARQSTTSAGV
jgi:hypothetical protein